MSLEAIDKNLRETEVRKRREYLTKQLRTMDIYQTKDGRRLEDVSLYTLHWTYIEAMNEAAKAYAEK